ncbi:Protein of unknown function [Verrucomicrobium sp. GAS474]|nr:Protein of unknown function [Verrucomicrobium sp. GAS474]
MAVLQPGLPEKPGSLRLIEAVLAFDGGPGLRGAVTVGAVQEEGETPLARIVWRGKAGDVPQIALEDNLLAPWAEVGDLIDPLMDVENEEENRTDAPGAEAMPADALLPLLEAAGAYRLRRRARRLAWRIAAVGVEQAVWEGVAEALGYGGNQVPFRHLARRLPLAYLTALSEGEREALLFGVAGFLPDGDVGKLPPPAREALKPLWEAWWPMRAGLDYAVLPAEAWSRFRIRPANRPERRLAALSRLVPQIPRLVRAVERRDPAIVGRICAECHDPFWSRHAAWTGKTSAKPSRLVGDDRADDLILNLFWPLVSLREPHGPAEALAALAAMPGGSNRAVRDRAAAWGLPPKACRSALVQQGILQVGRDLEGPTPFRPPGGLAGMAGRLLSAA